LRALVAAVSVTLPSEVIAWHRFKCERRSNFSAIKLWRT
jgi:hypothetical protein